MPVLFFGFGVSERAAQGGRAATTTAGGGSGDGHLTGIDRADRRDHRAAQQDPVGGEKGRDETHRCSPPRCCCFCCGPRGPHGRKESSWFVFFEELGSSDCTSCGCVSKRAGGAEQEARDRERMSGCARTCAFCVRARPACVCEPKSKETRKHAAAAGPPPQTAAVQLRRTHAPTPTNARRTAQQLN